MPYSIILGSHIRKSCSEDRIVIDCGWRCISRGGIVARLSPMYFTIASSLLARYPHHISNDELVAVVWGDREDGGPISASNCIRQMLWQGKQKLSEIAIAVVAYHGVGYEIRLLRMTLARAA